MLTERPRGVDGCKPDSVQRAACADGLDGHLSHTSPCGGAWSLRTATNTRRVSPLARRVGQATRSLLFCLAPHGVFPAPSVTLGAVSSYLAISPLPFFALRASKGGIFSATLSVALPLRPGAPAFTGHAAVWCPDFPLPPEGGSDHLRPVPRPRG